SNGGGTYLETYWTPPGGQRALLGAPDVRTAAGAWLPGTVPEPPPARLPAAIQALLSGQAPIGRPPAPTAATGSAGRPAATSAAPGQAPAPAALGSLAPKVL